MKFAKLLNCFVLVNDDVDGIPMDEPPPPPKPESPKMIFAPSKWETVDPSEVESQVVKTTPILHCTMT